MAQPSRKAVFFVTSDGIIIPKAPPISAAQRLTIFKRDNGQCTECRTKVSPFRMRCALFVPPVGAVDHILPRCRGGQNNPENLRLLCEPCNAAKGGKTDSEWRGDN